MVASNELRRRQQSHSQGLVITAKKLAGFLQSVEADELLMAQRLRDREAQAARNSLNVVSLTPTYPGGGEGEPMESNVIAVIAESADGGEVYGEF
jgi:hypothetical protein